jgi:drug/metabolite transporter (DMT)-like permease
LTDKSIAILLALYAAFGFGAGFVLTQFALRWMPPRLGAALSIPTSTFSFWCLAPFLIEPAEADAKAAALFACVGLIFPGAVALANFESNRLVGPNIAGAVGGLAPVFAVLLALFLLREHPRLLQLFGMGAIVLGVALMYRGQWSFTARGAWLLALPLGAAAVRGFVQPVIKIGLEHWPNPIAAVVIGYTVSSTVLVLAALASRPTLAQGFDRRGAIWFAAVGLCNGSAVLSMYAALGRGSVALVSPLIATYPLVTVLLSSALLKRERIDAPLIAAVIATVGGVILILIA